jgi:hypothetical protein
MAAMASAMARAISELRPEGVRAEVGNRQRALIRGSYGAILAARTRGVTWKQLSGAIKQSTGVGVGAARLAKLFKAVEAEEQEAAERIARGAASAMAARRGKKEPPEAAGGGRRRGLETSRASL